jgi:hypothetical protein
MPLVVEPADDVQASPDALGSWAAEHRHDLDVWLHRDGAVLLRGFGIGSPEEFRAVVAAIRPRLLDYVGGDSPRSNVADQVYTSTEFPPHLEISLHNELSYTRSWPERIFFCCLVVAKSGGETHIADSRKVLSSLEPAVRDRFSEKGVIYKQHLRDDDEPGPGKSWQETFETSDRAEVERICADQDMEFQWTGRGLHTSLSNPGVITHPIHVLEQPRRNHPPDHRRVVLVQPGRLVARQFRYGKGTGKSIYDGSFLRRDPGISRLLRRWVRDPHFGFEVRPLSLQELRSSVPLASRRSVDSR